MKCYTAWIFNGKDPNDLHCTHKFLGELSEHEQAKVVELIDSLFASKFAHAQFPRVAFERPQQFGPEKETRVLIPKLFDVKEFWPRLRSKLDKYRADDYSEYIPHVTTPDLDRVDERFHSYAFIKDGVVVKEWRNVL